MTEKKPISWLPIIFLLAGLSLGYTIVILRSNNTFASTDVCTAKEMKERWAETEFVVEKQYVQPDYIKFDDETFEGDAYPAYSWGVNIVEVEVNKYTYQVKLVHTWSVYDVGKAIDERIVIGQADGGLTQGITHGYLEVMKHEQGRIKQKNMTDYIIPTAMDTNH